MAIPMRNIGAAFLHEFGRAPTYSYGAAISNFHRDFCPSDACAPGSRLARETRASSIVRAAFNGEVTTEIDWLISTAGSFRRPGRFPSPLQTLRRGENTIQLTTARWECCLKTGSYGMLAGLGQLENDRLRFSRMQVGLLDALLASMPAVSVDKAFRRIADELGSFEGICSVDPPAAFVGTLREYQREGLGWLRFLERFGFGGCLADDMGLGKTVQVLAHMAGRAKERKKGARKLPTLIVVPKSLVFNWKQEAARFAPNLRVLDHTGQNAKSTEPFATPI